MSGRSPRWFTGIKPSYEANFSDNTWEQIIAICQKKVVPSTWKIGDQKAMMIGSTDYLVDIIIQTASAKKNSLEKPCSKR